MKANTEIPFYHPGDMGCIKIEVKVAGRPIYSDVATFHACSHGECLLRELGALIMKMPPEMIEGLINDGKKHFEIIAPDGTSIQKPYGDEDISRQRIAFCIGDQD